MSFSTSVMLHAEKTCGASPGNITRRGARRIFY